MSRIDFVLDFDSILNTRRMVYMLSEICGAVLCDIAPRKFLFRFLKTTVLYQTGFRHSQVKGRFWDIRILNRKPKIYSCLSSPREPTAQTDRTMNHYTLITGKRKCVMEWVHALKFDAEDDHFFFIFSLQWSHANQMLKPVWLHKLNFI